MSRRSFLKGSAAITAGALALPAIQGLGLLAENGRAYAAPEKGGYGSLSPVADLRDGVERIALPTGFRYRTFSVSNAGEQMSDGNDVPLAHDGMAGFYMPDGTIRLVRNHEDRNDPGAGSIQPTGSYDSQAGGGTTTLLVNAKTRELIRDFVSLSDTIVNCAGGPTPWGSWITCEETNEGVAQGWDAQHGYSFEVPATADGTVPAMPIREMGRFAHEAVAVDPASGIVYETEDAGNNSGFYRYIPEVPGQLLNGGQLQMLGIQGQSQYNTYTGHAVGTQLPAIWYDISDPDPVPGDPSVFNQGRAQGGAAFGRLEGCWYGNSAIYFVSTSGGSAGEGQIWEYRPAGDTGVLTLLFESPSAAVLNAPDNVTFTPQGGLLLCEDGSGDQYLRGLTINGEIFDFALNLENGSEWAGATFVEHGPGRGNGNTTLFVNRQGSTSFSSNAQGLTFAIWGPWNRGAF